MGKHISILLGFIALIVNVHADEYTGAMSEFYFGRYPGVKSEAMGKSGVSLRQGPTSAYLNPALLAFETGSEIGCSVSGPYYERDRARYSYFGMMYQKPGKGTFGFSRYGLNSRWLDDHLQDYMTQYALSYAFRLFPDFSIGVNVNWMRYKLDGLNANWDIHAVPVDVGVVKILNKELAPEWIHSAKIGAVVLNAIAAKIGVQEPKDPLPMVAKGGVSGHLALAPSFNWMDVQITVEYQHVLNSKYRRGFRGGIESTFFHYFQIRIGFYKETVDQQGNSINRKSIEDFTYGLGVALPLYQWSRNRIPVILHVDGVHLKQPSYSRIETDWEEFTGINLSLGWKKE